MFQNLVTDIKTGLSQPLSKDMPLSSILIVFILFVIVAFVVFDVLKIIQQYAEAAASAVTA